MSVWQDTETEPAELEVLDLIAQQLGVAPQKLMRFLEDDLPMNFRLRCRLPPRILALWPRLSLSGRCLALLCAWAICRYGDR